MLKKCSNCQKRIRNSNILGICAKCASSTKRIISPCSECGGKLSKKNVTGVCAKCYQNRKIKRTPNSSISVPHIYYKILDTCPPDCPAARHFTGEMRFKVLDQQPAFKCSSCSNIIHCTMLVTYERTRETYPMCIPCFEMENGIEVKSEIPMKEMAKISRTLHV